MYDIRGGDQYVINGNTLCSVGFAVAGGFVTAGHCGGAGSPTLGFNNVAQGTFAGSSFPGNDYAWVRTNGNWAPQPWVNNYAGGNVAGRRLAGRRDRQLDLPLRPHHRLALRHHARAATRRSTTRRARSPA